MNQTDTGRKGLPVMILRGGTSKGVYILKEDLPEDKQCWEKLLLNLMGSPDKKQINGLGGAQSVTSKVAIICKSDRPDADVDYTFAQVSVDKPLVSYRGNCGNISAGVGPFAIEKGLEEEYRFYSKIEKIAPQVISERRRIYKGVSANIDFYSGLIYSMLGIPVELFTPIFAIARMSGWSAHRIEELSNNGKIIRPAYDSVAEHEPYVRLVDRK